MIRMSLGVALLALVASATSARAQHDTTGAATPAGGRDRERWQVTLDGEQYVWDIRLIRLDRDSLVIRQADTLASLPVEHITEIRLIRASEMEMGAGAAGAMSALTGGDDEVYDLTPLDFADRIRAIQKILVYHPAQP
jgi:hypothetical protein